MKIFKIVFTIIVAILIVLNLFSIHYSDLSWSINSSIYGGLRTYVLILLTMKADEFYFKWRKKKKCS